MSTKRIVLEIGDDLELQVDMIGFVGDECERAFASVERRLGRPSVKQRKPDRYQTARQTNVLRSGQRHP